MIKFIELQNAQTQTEIKKKFFLETIQKPSVKKQLLLFPKTTQEEFIELINEIRPLKFNCSKEVSNYITHNNLEIKYKTLAGHLKFERNGDTWTMQNGIAPQYYKLLCQELNLGNQNSGAKVLEYKTNEEIYNF